VSFTPGSYLDLGLGVAYVEDISRSWCDSPDWRHNIPLTPSPLPLPPPTNKTLKIELYIARTAATTAPIP